MAIYGIYDHYFALINNIFNQQIHQKNTKVDLKNMILFTTLNWFYIQI